MKPEITSASASLPEVHSSVATAAPSIWRRMFAFAGPAYLVSVGYMDPGNWATDLEGGARFGYDLLWVLVMSNLMAILLQTLSARLGIVAQRDLAQACREAYPKAVSYALWILCEVAIAACDLAEVLGAAIGLNLLFGLPLIAGVIITAADTLLILWFTRMGIRVIEGFVLSLVAVITGCFLVELFIAKPAISAIANGLIPRLNDQSLYVAIGILGATVMPHNLYLHSALVQTRRIGNSAAEKRTACRFNLIDSMVALNGALIVNAAILILAAAVFFERNIVVTEIQQAHLMLAPLLGTTLASVLFAVALLAAGQSSTLTGTLAGQIVMEGFINLRMRPWLRRLITRLIAVIPAVFTIWYAGDSGTFQLLIFSQVILSMQLPFAVIPLVQFTSDRNRMGEFATPAVWRVMAWLVAAVIVALNIRLASNELASWFDAAGAYRFWLWITLGPLVAGLLGLLAWIILEPFLPPRMRTGRRGKPAVVAPEVAPEWRVPVYRSILLPLDHSDTDSEAITHAASLAKAHGAKLHVLHVEEGVTSQVYGEISSTAEIEAGQRYFESILNSLKRQGIDAELVIAHGRRPKTAIIETVQRLKPDLIVMGAHGHRGIQDLALGKTIDGVRHEVELPVLIVRSEKK